MTDCVARKKLLLGTLLHLDFQVALCASGRPDRTLADLLVRLSAGARVSSKLLCGSLGAELARTRHAETLFRTESMATHVVAALLHQRSASFLDCVRDLVCDVAPGGLIDLDALRQGGDSKQKKALAALRKTLSAFFAGIIDLISNKVLHSADPAIRALLSTCAVNAESHIPGSHSTAIVNALFLRLICPFISVLSSDVDDKRDAPQCKTPSGAETSDSVLEDDSPHGSAAISRSPSSPQSAAVRRSPSSPATGTERRPGRNKGGSKQEISDLSIHERARIQKSGSRIGDSLSAEGGEVAGSPSSPFAMMRHLLRLSGADVTKKVEKKCAGQPPCPRTLVLLSKALQTLVNGTHFKEDHMCPLNDLLDEFRPQMNDVISRLYEADTDDLSNMLDLHDTVLDFAEFIDLIRASYERVISVGLGFRIRKSSEVNEEVRASFSVIMRVLQAIVDNPPPSEEVLLTLLPQMAKRFGADLSRAYSTVSTPVRPTSSGDSRLSTSVISTHTNPAEEDDVEDDYDDASTATVIRSVSLPNHRSNCEARSASKFRL